jgi:hypothetical protein
VTVESYTSEVGVGGFTVSLFVMSVHWHRRFTTHRVTVCVRERYRGRGEGVKRIGLRTAPERKDTVV